jgi:hypothetical protein
MEEEKATRKWCKKIYPCKINLSAKLGKPLALQNVK